MQEKKIYLILLPAILVFLGIVAFLAFSGIIGQKKPTNIPTVEQKTTAPKVEVPNTPATGEAGGDFLLIAEQSQDASKCLGFTDEHYAMACVSVVAQKLQDPSACSVIKNQLEMVKCVDMVKFDKGVKGAKLSDCSGITDNDLSMACVVNLIDAKGFTIDDCQSLSEREKGFCQGHISFLKDVAAAKAAEKESDCQAITNDSAKSHCLDKFPPK